MHVCMQLDVAACFQCNTICPSAQQHLSTHYNMHNMYGMTEAIASSKSVSSTRLSIVCLKNYPSLSVTWLYKQARYITMSQQFLIVLDLCLNKPVLCCILVIQLHPSFTVCSSASMLHLWAYQWRHSQFLWQWHKRRCSPGVPDTDKQIPFNGLVSRLDVVRGNVWKLY